MLPNLVPTTRAAVPITPLAGPDLASWLRRQPEATRRWVRANRFRAKPGQACLVPGRDGRIARVLAGIGRDDEIWDWAAVAHHLPRGTYRVDGAPGSERAGRAALGWALEGYRFERYRKADAGQAKLTWPAGADRDAIRRAAEATYLVRDLINTPASDMGPAELAETARALAHDRGGRCTVIVGDELVRRNYPAIHAVGRASAREPRLIDLRWGDEAAPRLTVCGKGVCFDSGGLDLKPAAGMKLMKKDMGGAAHALGLASMIMEAGVPVRLRVLIPAVENSVGGNAMRPLDVIPTRKGVTVEIGNTDAEGRLVLADVLAEACSESPALLIDFATLTGAARVALGTELPALFCNDDKLARAIIDHGAAEADPVWRMPLWKPYRKQIDSPVADLTNAPTASHGGAITAALFLAEFVASGIPWAHIDLMGWNPTARPGRPEGGEAMTLRALYAMVRERFAV